MYHFTVTDLRETFLSGFHKSKGVCMYVWNSKRRRKGEECKLFATGLLHGVRCWDFRNEDNKILILKIKKLSLSLFSSNMNVQLRGSEFRLQLDSGTVGLYRRPGRLFSIVFLCVLCLVAQSCSTLCDLVDCGPPGSSVLGDSPGKTTGVGCHALLQVIFPTQGLNLHCRRILYHLSYQGSPCFSVTYYKVKPLWQSASREN